MLPESIFTTYPVAYAVADKYQIIVPVKAETLMWCNVNGTDYFDDSCGILRSNSPTHIMTIPADELDKARKYTICYREVINRKPYYSETSDVKALEIDFRPLTKLPANIYMVVDAHNRIDAPVNAAKFFPHNELDLLVLNGDIPEDGGRIENFATIHQIAGKITKGSIPVVFSRGNHDMRGIYAEKLTEHTPTDNGNTFFTFKLGPFWGMVLDCGEDKDDHSIEYGNTIACHAFRMRETEFIKQVIKNANSEYAAPQVQARLVICHIPFSQVFRAPFDIEQDTYRNWCKLLKDHVKPDLFLAGHVHQLYITYPADERDHLGQPCPVVAGAKPGPKPEDFIGTALTISEKDATISFVSSTNQVLESHHIEFRR
ncbi:MAG: hypothetical protein GX561_06040 [Lentisphaerae bacterium]|jgi:hypothetical protein|nr:hypothetical protein [Lentisphaerota bacterium]